MTETDMTIRLLAEDDIPQLAKMFHEQFPRLGWTRLGARFIRKFFHWHFENHPRLALVAERDGQKMGFLVGATGGHREYYRQVVRYAFPEFMLGSLLHPWLFLNQTTFAQWVDLLRNPGSPGINRKNRDMSKTGEKKAIVAFVAVTNAAQGKGVGAGLMNAFENFAFRDGNELLSSYTEIKNHAARRIHEKQGWKLVREDARRKMVYYSKRMGGNS